MNLFPTINLPTIATPQSSNENKFVRSPKFDWLTGDFVLDSSGRMILADERESFESWCLKVCQTERNTRLAYSDKIGVELENALKLPTPEAAKSAIIRTLTEALMIHPLTEAIKNFSFGGDGDGLRVTFDVQSKIFDESISISVTY